MGDTPRTILFSFPIYKYEKHTHIPVCHIYLCLPTHHFFSASLRALEKPCVMRNVYHSIVYLNIDTGKGQGV